MGTTTSSRRMMRLISIIFIITIFVCLSLCSRNHLTLRSVGKGAPKSSTDSTDEHASLLKRRPLRRSKVELISSSPDSDSLGESESSRTRRSIGRGSSASSAPRENKTPSPSSELQSITLFSLLHEKRFFQVIETTMMSSRLNDKTGSVTAFSIRKIHLIVRDIREDELTRPKRISRDFDATAHGLFLSKAGRLCLHLSKMKERSTPKADATTEHFLLIFDPESLPLENPEILPLIEASHRVNILISHCDCERNLLLFLVNMEDALEITCARLIENHKSTAIGLIRRSSIELQYKPNEITWVPRVSESGSGSDSRDVPPLGARVLHRAVIWLSDKGSFYSGFGGSEQRFWATIQLLDDYSITCVGFEVLRGIGKNIFRSIFMPLRKVSSHDRAGPEPSNFLVPNIGGNWKFMINTELVYVTSRIDNEPFRGEVARECMPSLSSTVMNMETFILTQRGAESADQGIPGGSEGRKKLPHSMPRSIPQGVLTNIRVIQHAPLLSGTTVLRNFAVMHPVTFVCYFLGISDNGLYLISLAQGANLGRVLADGAVFEYEFVQKIQRMCSLPKSHFVDPIVHFQYLHSDKLFIFFSSGRYLTVTLQTTHVVKRSPSKMVHGSGRMDSMSMALYRSPFHELGSGPSDYDPLMSKLEGTTPLLSIKLPRLAYRFGSFTGLRASSSPSLDEDIPILVRTDPHYGHMVVVYHGGPILFKQAAFGRSESYWMEFFTPKRTEKVENLFIFSSEELHAVIVVVLADNYRGSSRIKCFIHNVELEEVNFHAHGTSIWFVNGHIPKDISFDQRSNTLIWVCSKGVNNHVSDQNIEDAAVIGWSRLLDEKNVYYETVPRVLMDDVHGMVSGVIDRSELMMEYGPPLKKPKGVIGSGIYPTTSIYLIASVGTEVFCFVYKLAWHKQVLLNLLITSITARSPQPSMSHVGIIAMDLTMRRELIERCTRISLWKKAFVLKDEADDSSRRLEVVLVCEYGYIMRNLFLVFDPEDSIRPIRVLFHQQDLSDRVLVVDSLSNIATVPHQTLGIDFVFELEPGYLVTLPNSMKAFAQRQNPCMNYRTISVADGELSAHQLSIQTINGIEYVPLKEQSLNDLSLRVSDPVPIPFRLLESHLILDIQHSAALNGFIVAVMEKSSGTIHIIQLRS